MSTGDSAWLACLILALVIEVPRGDDSAFQKNDEVAQAMLNAHNAERKSLDLPELELHEGLMRAALEHAQDMAARSEMTHEGADGLSAVDRVARQSFPGRHVGENIASGQPGVSSVIRAWMESPGHKKNIVGDFAQMGAARVEDGDGKPYWCVVFGTAFPRLDPQEAARGLLDGINQERERTEKPPFTQQDRLAEIAQVLAKEFAESIANPEAERTPSDLAELFKKSKYPYRNVTQILAAGEPTAEAAVKTMLADEDRHTLLMGDAKAVGVGYVVGEDDTPVWCLLLVED